MFWIDRLAQELTRALGKGVDRETLYREFQNFRDECKDRDLRQSYPSDLHHFKRGATPQRRTVDIILSFMDQKYPQLKLPMVRELARGLEDAARKKRRAGEIEQVLTKERLRRYLNREDTYWGITQARMREKYAGVYSLIRIDSGNLLRAEPFAIAAPHRDPLAVSAFWFCRDRLRVGDLFVNTYWLAGLTMRKSTDNVIEPAPLCILRAPTPTNPDDSKLPLVLGGFVIGGKDNEPEALAYSRLALIKLNVSHPKIATAEDFVAITEKPEIKDCLDRLLADRIVAKSLKRRFLQRREREFGQLAARNALPGLTHTLVTPSSP